jgi:hypothetical protein
MIGHFKSRATRRLKEVGLWHDDERRIWGEHGWNIYLDETPDVDRAIRYVEQNPMKEGKTAQHWSLVTPFVSSTAKHMRVVAVKRRAIGGAALRSQAEARRKRRG